MKNKHVISLLSALCVLGACSLTTRAQTPVSINVSVNKPKADIQSTMWGIFFEDINLAADGGIYAELVKNRSFEFEQPLMGWKLLKSDKFSLNKESGSILVINREVENPANPHFARVSVNSTTPFVITNEGFRGMGIKKDNQYNFSVWAAQREGNVKMVVELIDDQGSVIGTTSVTPSGKEWKQYKANFRTSTTQQKASMRLRFEGKGDVDVDMISLFPQDTWKQRPNGLRADLVQLLADMKPGFIRFPGGCIVEGFHLDTRYQWKRTVGAPEARTLIKNRWNDEFKHRLTPDYYQSFGLGFYEYFLLAEDIGASPLPILSCGMACQFNSAEVVPLDQLDPYVQDALDLIEFANGPSDSKWGKVRTQMGHPAPFNMKLIGVGNEQWGPQYIERYKVFSSAIKAKYPDIKIVSGAGPFAEGEMFDYASKELKELKADIVDEHYYKSPDWFLKNAGRYDSYDRNAPKIFSGEYAAQSVSGGSPENKNTWLCALSEAAFMTGLERNADLVTMASYAPLFAHVEGWQWTPDLIWFDNLSSYGTPNYYVQKLFSTNRGTQILPITSNGTPLEGEQKLYASATFDKATSEVIVKVVNAGDAATVALITLDGVGKAEPMVRQFELKSQDLGAVNSIGTPRFVGPVETTFPIKGKVLKVTVAPQSLTVYRVKVK